MRALIHPGETLREDLDALGRSAAPLARGIEVPVNCSSQILNGQRAVTGDTGTAPRALLRDLRASSAQPPETLRVAACGARERRGDRPATYLGHRQCPARGGLTGPSGRRRAPSFREAKRPSQWCAFVVQAQDPPHAHQASMTSRRRSVCAEDHLRTSPSSPP